MAAVAATTDTARDGATSTPVADDGVVTRALRGRPWLAPAGLGVAVGLATLYTALNDPDTGGVFPGCPLREATGWDCPGCGGMRATHALATGDLAGALDHNLVITLLLPVAVVLWAAWLLRSLGVRVPALPRPGRAAWWALGLLLAAFTITRNIDGIGLFEYLGSTA